MSQNLEKLVPQTHVAEIVHHGEQLTVPSGMSLDSAIALLERRKTYMETAMSMQRSFPYFVWDGALALQSVIARIYGWVEQQPTPGFWGDTPPRLISVNSGPNETVQVPWGTIRLPEVKGVLHTGHEMINGIVCFKLTANITRADERVILNIFAEVRKELQAHSIYRGKVVKIRFKDDDGDRIPLPTPEFIDPFEVDRGQLIYSAPVEASIETNLFTPIRRVADCLANGIAVKRGVLLGGTYGTGKTLAAKVAARVAAENNITFIYCPRADELADAIAFAKCYQSPACVVFCEDVDRVMSGERDVEMDDILNIIDGIDTKQSNIIVVLTTNNLEGVNAAMLRPGRLDAVIEVTPPDAEAVTRLLRYYGTGLIDPAASLERAGAKLEGTIPAVISEVVKRAKLVELKLLQPGERIKLLSEKAILEAAETMSAQLSLLESRTAQDNPNRHQASDLEQSMIALIKKATSDEAS